MSFTHCALDDAVLSALDLMSIYNIYGMPLSTTCDDDDDDKQQAADSSDLRRAAMCSSNIYNSGTCASVFVFALHCVCLCVGAAEFGQPMMYTAKVDACARALIKSN